LKNFTQQFTGVGTSFARQSTNNFSPPSSPPPQQQSQSSSQGRSTVIIEEVSESNSSNQIALFKGSGSSSTFDSRSSAFGQSGALMVVGDTSEKTYVSMMDINFAGLQGMTALHRAVIQGHFQIVELLMKAGADATVKDEAGLTPIDYATKHVRPEMLEVMKNRPFFDVNEFMEWAPDDEDDEIEEEEKREQEEKKKKAQEEEDKKKEEEEKKKKKEKEAERKKSGKDEKMTPEEKKKEEEEKKKRRREREGREERKRREEKESRR